MEDEEEKQITLHHNGYNISIKIRNDYDNIKDAVKRALYYTDAELEKININFLDDDECENILDEDNCDDAFNAKEWTTSKKDSDEPGPIHDEEEIKKLKEEIDKLKAKLKNSNSLQDAVKKCNEKYKVQLEQLKNKFINELKQREALNKNNIEEITKNLTEYAQNTIKTKVEGYNNNIQNVLNTKIEASKTKLTQDNQDINNILKDINNNKDDIKKQIGESNTNFSKIIEISQINVNDNK